MDLSNTLLFPILLLGTLVALHEWGHYITAKWAGVKVLEYAVGFGPKVVSGRWGETVYSLRAIPLGGFCKLLGQESWEDVDPAETHRTLVAQTPWRRFLVVFAGPAINLALPIALFYPVAWAEWGAPRPAARLGLVFGEAAVAAGLTDGDIVRAIDGNPVVTWDDMAAVFSASPEKTLKLTVERDGGTLELQVTPAASLERNDILALTKVGRIGVSQTLPLAVIGVADPAAPAYVAGLRTGDRITAVNGRAVDSWADARRELGAACGKPVSVTVLRPREPLPAALPASFAQRAVYRPADGAEPRDFLADAAPLTASFVLPADPGCRPGDGAPDPKRHLGGVLPAFLFVGAVDARTELGAQLQPGDFIAAADGRPLRHLVQLESSRFTGPQAFRLSVIRNGEALAVEGRATPVAFDGPLKDLPPDWELGFAPVAHPWRGAAQAATTTDGYSWSWFAAYPFVETWKLVKSTIRTIAGLFVGDVRVNQLGGFITIMHVAGRASSEGWIEYLRIMALISVNLGVLNLLPIPVLDGGHILFYAYEGLSGRPVPENLKVWLTTGGFLLLLMLMLFVFANDVLRYWGVVTAWFMG